MPVHMNVMSHQLVGSFLSRLAMQKERPETLEGFMTELADFANRELGVETITAQYDQSVRAWRVAGIIEMFDVDDDARTRYATHTDEEVVIRLPDPELLSESRNLAVAFDAGRRRGQFYVQPFYYNYMRGGDSAPSNSEYLDSRIADYVFSQCR